MNSIKIIQEDQTENRVIISNYRSLLFFMIPNFLIEFVRRKIHVVALIMLWVTIYITILQNCNEVTCYTMFLLLME